MIQRLKLSCILFSPFGDIWLSTNWVYSPKYSNLNSSVLIGKNIAVSAAALIPNDTLNGLVFGFTSAAMVIGFESVAEDIRKHKPDTAVTDPMALVLTALKAPNAKRIAVITLYIGEVNVRRDT
jgi:maleate cis-trans isomerase